MVFSQIIPTACRTLLVVGAAVCAASSAAAHGYDSFPTAEDEAPLPDFSGTRLESYNWTNPWTPSDWTEPKLPDYVWSHNNVAVEGGDLVLRLDDRRTGQVQAHDAAFSESALFEVDTTLPEMVPGLIAAPLWLYNLPTRDEIDFEVVGTKGLTITIYAGGEAVFSDLIIPGDLSNARFRLGIEYRAGEQIRFLVDGDEVLAVTPDETDGGAFPTAPLKPYIELWPTEAEGWAGRWRPLLPGEELVMRVHGYASHSID